jgi:hypothetical protein
VHDQCNAAVSTFGTPTLGPRSRTAAQLKLIRASQQAQQHTDPMAHMAQHMATATGNGYHSLDRKRHLYSYNAPFANGCAGERATMCIDTKYRSDSHPSPIVEDASIYSSLGGAQMAALVSPRRYPAFVRTTVMHHRVNAEPDTNVPAEADMQQQRFSSESSFSCRLRCFACHLNCIELVLAFWARCSCRCAGHIFQLRCHTQIRHRYYITIHPRQA